MESEEVKLLLTAPKTELKTKARERPRGGEEIKTRRQSERPPSLLEIKQIASSLSLRMLCLQEDLHDIPERTKAAPPPEWATLSGTLNFLRPGIRKWEEQVQVTFDFELGRLFCTRYEPPLRFEIEVGYMEDISFASKGQGGGGDGSTLGENAYLEAVYAEELQALGPHLFKVFSPGSAFLFSAPDAAGKGQFCQALTHYMDVCFPKDVLRQKESALRHFLPYIQRDSAEYYSCKLLQKTLNHISSMEANPIGSKRKTKCGLLDLLDPLTRVWSACYFVLHGSRLYYYNSSRDEEYAGFISFRSASVGIDHTRSIWGEHVLTITTPVVTLSLRMRHAVALSEWIAALERAFQTWALTAPGSLPATRRKRCRPAGEILVYVNKLSEPLRMLHAVLRTEHLHAQVFPHARQQRQVELIKRLQRLRAKDAQRAWRPGELRRACDQLRHDLFRQRTLAPSSSAAQAHVCLDHGPSKFQAEAGGLWMFDQAVKEAVAELVPVVQEFKVREVCGDLKLLSPAAPRARDVADFLPKYKCQWRITIDKTDKKGKTTSVSKRVKFPYKHARRKSLVHKSEDGMRSYTVGRDKSNWMVFDDIRVSRQHARVEFNDHRCSFHDLGSSRGTTLNGAAVTRARLQAGDVIAMGKVTLVFEVVPRRTIFQKLFTKKTTTTTTTTTTTR